MNDLMVKWFGASWVTTVLGYIGMIGSFAQLLAEALATNGLPTNSAAWITLILSIGLKLTKQQNVTNAAEAVPAKMIKGPALPLKVVVQEGQQN